MHGSKEHLPIVTGGEMAALEQRAQKQFYLSSALLMERAGYEIARVLHEELFQSPRSRPRIHVVCGGGKNGGDGFVAARMLHHHGARVKVWLVGEPSKMQKETAHYARVAAAMGLSYTVVDGESVKRFSLALRMSDAILDALVGTGLRGGPRPMHRSVIDAMNGADRPIYSVDIPTGVDADNGHVASTAVRAKATISFSLPKIGHMLYPGRAHTGRLHIVHIGLPHDFFIEYGPQRLLLHDPWAAAQLKRRPADGHKGTFGRLLVLAGSVGMAGAAALTARGALHSGVGIVTCAVPADIVDTIQKLVPEAIAMPWPERDGTWVDRAYDMIASWLKPGDAVAIGPGLGRSPSTDELVHRVYARLPADVVVDADGLNALAEAGEGTVQYDGPHARVLTPHPKEAARLLETDTRSVVNDPIGSVHRLAQEYRATAVLKGSTSLVRAPDGMSYVNGSGDVSLATGGSGDVLTGVIGALLAQRYSPPVAAALGAYVHGIAGEKVGERIGRYGGTARHIADFVADAFLRVERVKEARYDDE